MTNKFIVAVIAEGNAERAIIDVLLEHDALIFDKDEMLQGEVLRIRNAKSFEKKYLNKGMDRKIKIYRILDSKKEKFKLSKVYEKKVDEVINVHTRPESEILFILYNDDYNKYKQSRLKPSEYASKNYKLGKSYDTVSDFWDKHFSELIPILKKYNGMHNSDTTIYDLLKKEFK